MVLPLIETIWVDEESFNSTDTDKGVSGCVSLLIGWYMDVCGLEVGEFPIEALNGYWADQYAGDVALDGHAAFAERMWESDEAMGCTEAGLLAIGATQELQAFREFLSRIGSLEDAVMKENLGLELEEIIAFDNRVDFLRVQQLHEAWLRTLPNLRVMPLEQLNREKEALRARMEVVRKDSG